MQEKQVKDAAEYHRRKVMSHDDRAMISRDIIAKNIHEQNQRDGKNSSFDSAHRKATEIAHKEERRKSEK